MKFTRLLVFRIWSILSILTVIIASIIINYQLGFYTITEAEMYIPFFLSDLSLIHKLFYFPITDFYYRARELSTAFNIIDTYILAISAKLGIPHFLSGIHYLTLLVIAFITTRFFKKLDIRGRVNTLLLILAFFTSPAVFLTGMYFRPTKILVSLGIVLCILFLWAIHKKNKVIFSPFRAALLLTLCMGLTDELGLVFTILFGLYCLAVAMYQKSHTFHMSALGFLGGNIALFAYRSFIGPMIIKHFLHMSPTTWGIAGLNIFNTNNIPRSFSLLLRYLQFFAGNTPMSIALILAALTFCIYVAIHKGKAFSPKAGTIALIIMSAGLIFFTALYHVLSLRHVVLFWLEYSIIYYPMPLYALLFSILLILVPVVSERSKKIARAIPMILLLWVATNIAALPTHIKTLKHPLIKTSTYYGLAHPMVQALQHPDSPIETFNLEHFNGVETIRNWIK